jgi:5'-nucleotidase
MIILVDMDGVIADWEAAFYQKWREAHPEKMYIPLEERKGHYVYTQFPEDHHEDVRSIYRCEGFYRNLLALEGGIEAMLEMKSMGHEVFICTAPMHPRYENCVLEKYHWVNEKLGEEWTSRIVMTRDKTLVKGDILIDDNPDITGAVKPEWEHVVYDQPYNRELKDKRRLTWKNWKEVLGI